MRTIAHRGVGGGLGSRLRMYAKKLFLDHKISKLSFFVQKKLLHCHLLLCIEKCKPASSYKQKP